MSSHIWKPPCSVDLKEEEEIEALVLAQCLCMAWLFMVLGRAEGKGWSVFHLP